MKLPLLTRLFGAIFPPQDLWKAASIGDVSAIRRLTAEGSDINAKRRTLSVQGDAPLHFAARHSQSEAVRALVGLGAKIDARTDHGTTPLIEAAANMASVETVEALIVMGANINAQDKNGYTALSWAAYGADETLVTFLLAKGANPNQEKGNMKSEVLTNAIRGGNSRVFNMLLEAGARPGRTGDIDPPLTIAALLGHAHFAEMLLKAGAAPNTVNGSGIPALICAVRGGNIDVLKLLMQAGADLNDQNAQGETALDVAHDERRTTMIDLLSKAGAKRGIG